MISTVFRKEFIELGRDRRFLVISLLMVALLLAAALDGWNRASTDRQARAAAVATDREIWIEQGENNPHGAAHFARYAFREAPALAGFDPGVFDFAGAAFWMEAHTQNPTTIRRAEDAAARAPFASISPAWVLQVVGTLVLATVLFAAVAGERERGTLRTLAAAGVSAREFATGKVGALSVLVAIITLLAILIAMFPSVASDVGSALPGSHLIALISVYFLGLLGFACIVLWISARARSVGDAFNDAAVAWLFFALISPVLGGQLAMTFYPDIDERTLENNIQLKAQSPFWTGEARKPAVERQEKQVLEEYGGESFESLGFDREAMVLQAHEEFANEVYDELYGALKERHFRQDAVLRYMALVSPVFALQRLSMGLSGTDLLAQWRYAEQGEHHRRQIIAQLNLDMMLHGGEKGFEYTADRSLWEAIPDFEPKSPSLGEIFAYYSTELLALVLWLLLAGSLALRATRQALTRGF